MSDVRLGKWCKAYGIPKPKLGYWAKVQHGLEVPEREQAIAPNQQKHRK